MTQEVMINGLAHIAMFGMFAMFLWFSLMLVITLITPKSLLDKYFKEPHFNAGEMVAFSSFPAFFIRTSLFCRLYITPKAVKGRQLDGFVEDSPKWYKYSVVTILLGCILHGVLAFGCVGIVLMFTS